MSNATQEKQKTAVEIFQTGGQSGHYCLTQTLGRLLSNESVVSHLTLQEFQDNFEWDESYSVKASWEVFVPDHTQTFECSSKEEALAYVRGEKEVEEPEVSPLDLGWELSVEGDCSLVIEVKNLRLKPQQRFA